MKQMSEEVMKQVVEALNKIESAVKGYTGPMPMIVGSAAKEALDALKPYMGGGE